MSKMTAEQIALRNLLSEGAPSDTQIQRLREAVFAQSQRERNGKPGAGVYYPSIEAAKTIISAAGVAPQESRVFDREKVKAWLQREFGSVLAHDPHNPERFWGGSADALCVAYMEGKLT